MSDSGPIPFSERSAVVEPFLAMEVLERAQQLERQGRTICHLEVGEPAFSTPAAVIRAGTEAIERGDTHYTHSMGLLELRQEIARRYRDRYDVDVDVEQVLVTMGSSTAFLFVFATLLEPGDEVLVGTPHYSCYPNFVRFFGGKLITVPTDPADGYRVDPDEIARRVTDRTRAILINSPCNPTGAVLDGERLKAIAAIGPPVISDEIYHGLTYEGRDRSMLEYTARTFVVDGFSKRYAMTGWRLGWVVSPPEAVRRLQTLQQNFQISVTAFVQHAGIAALRSAESDVEAMRATYDVRRHRMVDIVRRAGFDVPVSPQGAFYVFADASRFTTNSLDFAFELLEHAGVGVSPGIDYGEAGRRSVRFSYTADEATIDEAGRRLETYLRTRARPS